MESVQKSPFSAASPRTAPDRFVRRSGLRSRQFDLDHEARAGVMGRDPAFVQVDGAAGDGQS